MPYLSFAPLPDEVVNRLFTALTVRYGAPFTDRWRDLDLDVVKGDWARALAPYTRDFQAIRWALDHLPEKPPTVIEFRKLCDAAPPPQQEALNPPPVRGPKPEELARLQELRHSFPSSRPTVETEDAP